MVYLPLIRDSNNEPIYYGNTVMLIWNKRITHWKAVFNNENKLHLKRLDKDSTLSFISFEQLKERKIEYTKIK